ncbi:hypothetical protein BJX61DRAFT_495256 [Aspergillus egyptiacus]|nr:hypothetical protein BJX61DRAFT_495256 [Aspergillus egyptiacus]
MGSFTIYCAGCAGPFTRPSLGSTSQRALARRARRIQRTLNPGHYDGEVDEDGTEEEEGEKASQTTDEDDSEIDEDWSYNPEILTEDHFNWLEYLICLGFNERAFISGPGEYIEQGRITAVQGDDSNCPEGENSFSCYTDGGTPAVFPFHPECFDILTMVITGSRDAGLLDKDTLYRALVGISEGRYLDVDYGPISGNAQFWESIPGEEFSVRDPLDIPDMKEFLHDELLSNSFKVATSNLDFQRKVVKDPLSALPYDILHLISCYLPGAAVLSLMTASLPVFMATSRHNGFWKLRIQRDMPWFWELRELITQCDYPDLDFKGLYLWLDKMTTPRFGIEDMLTGIANRRRIWGVCEKIRDLYCSGRY